MFIKNVSSFSVIDSTASFEESTRMSDAIQNKYFFNGYVSAIKYPLDKLSVFWQVTNVAFDKITKMASSIFDYIQELYVNNHDVVQTVLSNLSTNRKHANKHYSIYLYSRCDSTSQLLIKSRKCLELTKALRSSFSLLLHFITQKSLNCLWYVCFYLTTVVWLTDNLLFYCL